MIYTYLERYQNFWWPLPQLFPTGSRWFHCLTFLDWQWFPCVEFSLQQPFWWLQDWPTSCWCWKSWKENNIHLIQLMRLFYLSHRRPAKAQASLRICAVSPEPSLFAHIKYGSRWRVRPKIRHLPHWMAAHALLKNEFTEDETCHNLLRWLNFHPTHRKRDCVMLFVILQTWDSVCEWTAKALVRLHRYTGSFTCTGSSEFSKSFL